MSVRKITVEAVTNSIGMALRMRTPSKPFKDGDILCLHMPDRSVRFLVGSPKHPPSCSDCAMYRWSHCVRTRNQVCIRRYTENNNVILNLEKVLEEI